MSWGWWWDGASWQLLPHTLRRCLENSPMRTPCVSNSSPKSARPRFGPSLHLYLTLGQREFTLKTTRNALRVHPLQCKKSQVQELLCTTHGPQPLQFVDIDVAGGGYNNSLEVYNLLGGVNSDYNIRRANCTFN